MKSLLSLWICCCVWVLNAPLAAETPGSPTLTVGGDVWCPVNCDSEDARPGIGIDLAKRVFEPLGYEIRYIVIPWSRALEEVRAGRIDAVVGASHNDDPLLIFPSHAIAMLHDDIFVTADSDITFKTMESLQGKRLGIIKDYGYSKPVQSFIDANRRIPDAIQEVGGMQALEQNIRKLLAGRIDAVIENGPIMDYRLGRMGLSGALKPIGSIPQGGLYLAFSPALEASKGRAAAYDKAVEALKQQGELEALYAPYGMKP